MQTTGTENALIIAPQWLGDAVMTEPLLRRLRARGLRTTVAALPHIAPVYRCIPHVAEVVELPFAHGKLDFGARRRLAKSMVGKFASAYVLPNSIKAALLPWLADIPQRVGYMGEARVGLLTHRLPNPGQGSRPAMVPFYSALSGDGNVDNDMPSLEVPQQDVDALLESHGLQSQQYALFAPGSEYGSAKRWPAVHFAALAKQWHKKTNQPIVLLGSSKEIEIGNEIALGQNHVLNWIGKTNLAQAFAAIAGAAHVVSNDSGLMHVAAALKIPQTALFGSSSPEHTPPLSMNAQVIWLKNQASTQPPLDCAPCYARECQFGHTRCLTEMLPKQVFNTMQFIATK